MKFLNNISFYLIKGLCLIVGALPFWVLYHPIVNFVYFVVYKLFKYRIGVVSANLKRAFPEYSDAERYDIERKFYRNLAEIFVDTIDIVGLTKRQVKKRITIADLEQHKARVEGKDWISAMAHYGSWEYSSTYCFFDNTHDLAAIYKPLKNKVADRFFKSFRTQYGATVVPMAEIIRFVLTNKRTPNSNNVVLAMIADQSPERKSHFAELEFLGIDTKFFTGVEKMALKFKMPVYFLDIQKTSPAHYIYTFVQIFDGEESVEENEITRRYVEKLEAMIRRCPELWLWSHRRWKRSKRQVNA